MLLDVLYGQWNFIDIFIGFLSCMVVIFITLPIHEWAHGFVSTKLGDPTPRWQGRLTLNPMAHIDWIGAAGILLFGIGWAKPVQVNARYYKNPKWGMAIVALAGPLSNIIVAFIFLFLSNLVQTLTLLSAVFWMIARININLAVFNLIPIPPFDGSRILFTFLPQRYYFKIMQYERFIFIGILALLYSGVLDLPLAIASGIVMDAVSALAALPFNLLGV